MAKAKKLPSGNWRVQVFDYKDENGKNHYRSYTAPTRAEAEYMAALFKKDRPEREERPTMTVGEAIDRYIELSPMLSPTTLARYRNVREHGFPELMDMTVDELTDEVVQTEINKESRRPNKRTRKPLSPKTIKNEYGVISSALKTVCNRSFNVRLPKNQKKPKELPPPEVIISLLKGTSIELPCLLSIWLSFSLSEIRGFRCSSVRDGYIYVDQVLVEVENMPVIKKDAKVESRNRRQAVPEYIMDLIKRQDTWIEYTRTGKDGPLIPLNRHQIYNRYKRIMEKNGLEISFHDLRHMFASIMLTKLQIPEKVVQDEGGWSTPHVMKSVYSNTFSDSRKTADIIRDDFFKSLL